MKTFRLALAAFIFVACHTEPPFGDGSYPDHAVVIEGANDEQAGVAAEMAWLREHYPGFKDADHSMIISDGRKYDMITFTTHDRRGTVYFFITQYLGK